MKQKWKKLITQWYFSTTDSCLIFSKWIFFSISCICWSLYKWPLVIFIKWIKIHFTLHFGWCVDSNVDLFVGKFSGYLLLFCSCFAHWRLGWCADWCLAWLFVKIHFTFDLHIYLIPKNHFFHSNQPRTGIFFKGLFGPRSKPSPLIIDLPVSNTNHFQPCQALNLWKVSNTVPDRPFQLLRCLSLISNTVHFSWPC